MIYRYGDCKRCHGCGEISVFRPRSFDPEPCREVPCPSCEGTGVVAVGVLNAEELALRIQALQQHALDHGQPRQPMGTMPGVPSTENLLRDHAAAAE